VEKHIVKRLLYAWAFLGLVFAFSREVQGSYIYWSDFGPNFGQPFGDIRRANLDGTGPRTIVTGLTIPSRPAVDVARGQVYWAQVTTPGTIWRAPLDGSNNRTLLINGLPSPGGTTLDLVHDQIYWSDGEVAGTGQGHIRRANLDGTGQMTLVTGLTNPLGVALDVDAGKMYWTDNGTGSNGDVRRANLDGSGQEVLLRNLFDPRGLDLDLVSRKLYWTDGSGGVARANLDGSGRQTLINYGAPSIALDVAGGMFYCTDNPGNTIWRANLNGSGGRQIVLRNLSSPHIVTFAVPEPGTALFLIAACSLLGRSSARRKRRTDTRPE
jgi:low density lipoprotein receptor-related protein 5/6